jgi:hypothetical protein
MARLQWALTCRDVSIDGATNNITYRDAIEQLRVREFPADIPPFILVAVLWRREDIDTPESLEYRITLEDYEGNRSGYTEPQEVDLESFERVRASLPNPPMEIEEPGTIWFVIEKNENGGWEEASRLPVEIKSTEESEVEISAEEAVAED